MPVTYGVLCFIDKFLLVRYSGKAPVETCLKDTKPTVTFHLECGSHVGQPTLDDRLGCLTMSNKTRKVVG